MLFKSTNGKLLLRGGGQVLKIIEFINTMEIMILTKINEGNKKFKLKLILYNVDFFTYSFTKKVTTYLDRTKTPDYIEFKDDFKTMMVGYKNKGKNPNPNPRIEVDHYNCEMNNKENWIYKKIKIMDLMEVASVNQI